MELTELSSANVSAIEGLFPVDGSGAFPGTTTVLKTVGLTDSSGNPWPGYGTTKLGETVFVDGSGGAWPGDGTVLSQVVLGTAADSGVAWPDSDAAAQTLLDGLLAATPVTVAGSTAAVVSATYTVGTDQLVVTYADDANGYATGIAVNDLSATVLSQVALGTAADSGVAWPDSDAAAQNLLNGLLGASPTLVMGTSETSTVVSATYTVGTDQLVVTYADDANGYATGIAVTADGAAVAVNTSDMGTDLSHADMIGIGPVAVAVNTSAMGADLSHASMIADTTAVAANKAILADLLAAAPTVASDGTTSTHTATTASNDYSLVVTYNGNGNATGVVIHDVTGNSAVASVTIDPSVTALTHSGLYNDATNILTSVTDTALLAVINDAANFPSTPTNLKVETGSNSWSYDENGDGTIQSSEIETSSFKYVYAVESDGAWTLVSGVETYGGSTSEYGFNWTGGTTTTDITASGFTAMTDADLLVNATDYLSKQFIESQFPSGSVEFTDGTANATPGTAVTDIVPHFVDSGTDTCRCSGICGCTQVSLGW